MKIDYPTASAITSIAIAFIWYMRLRVKTKHRQEMAKIELEEKKHKYEMRVKINQQYVESCKNNGIPSCNRVPKIVEDYDDDEVIDTTYIDNYDGPVMIEDSSMKRSSNF